MVFWPRLSPRQRRHFACTPHEYTKVAGTDVATKRGSFRHQVSESAILSAMAFSRVWVLTPLVMVFQPSMRRGLNPDRKPAAGGQSNSSGTGGEVQPSLALSPKQLQEVLAYTRNVHDQAVDLLLVHVFVFAAPFCICTAVVFALFHGWVLGESFHLGFLPALGAFAGAVHGLGA